MHHPQPYSDTDPRAMEVWIDLLRSKSPGQKIIDSLESSDMLFGFAEAGVRVTHPEASDREVFLRAAARHLSPPLMRKVYGWHPDDEPAVTSA